MLPLRVMDGEPTGRLVFQGDTVNVGAGGVYFKTLNWHELRVGMPVHVTIDIPPEMFQLLPFGGFRGSGEIVRIEPPIRTTPAERATRGVAVRMTSRLKFDSDLHLPRFDSGNRPSADSLDSAGQP